MIHDLGGQVNDMSRFTDGVELLKTLTTRACLAAVISVAMSFPAHPQSVVPRIKGSCPVGTYRSGDYCQAYRSTRKEGGSFIVKAGSHCPVGYYSAGKHHCRQFSRTDETAIPGNDSNRCPTGWYRSGSYCRTSNP